MQDNDIQIKVHNLPSVVMLECPLPSELVDSLNEYLDEYIKQEDTKHKNDGMRKQ